MTRKLFLIAVAVFAAIAGIVFFEVELQRFTAVRAIDGALIEHFFVELDGIAALRAGDFVIAFVFVVFPCVVIVIVFILVDVVELFFQLAEVFVDLVYLTAELAPRILTLNNAKKGTRIWTAGVDLGAYHAVHCRLRRPTLFAGAVGMGGIYDLTRFWGTDSDDMVLRCAPLAYLQENGIANKPALAKAEENSLILCAGQGAYEGDALDDTQALADLLKDQGMPAHLEIWGGDVSHDWYWWGKMWSLFAPRILEVK